MTTSTRWALLFTVLGASACGDAGGETAPATATRSLWATPAAITELSEETFFEHPWPSDLRNEGGVRFVGWPNPRTVLLLDEYITFMDGKLDGFSTIAAGFLRFDGPLDPATLPDPAGSLSPDAAVQLVDVDPSSPEHGQRKLVTTLYREEIGVYWQPHTLSFMPVPGFPLRPRTKYAFVVTNAARAPGGSALLPATELTEALGLADPSSEGATRARDLLAPTVAELAAAGVPAESIVHLAAFTTNDPAEEYLLAAESLPDQIEAPTADAGAWELQEDGEVFDEYVGSYGPLPNFQAGTLPFSGFGDGGGFVPDENGVPQVVDTFEARFSLSVPDAAACPMPAGGYPIVLYAHGTTGSYRSYVFDGTARALAQRCLATMGVDQIFHGTRPGTPDSETTLQRLFFNFLNIESARTNVRQSGLDEVQRARLFTEGAFEVPAAVSVTGSAITFDGDRMSFFGHSQGALNGPLFLAGSAAPRGAVLSGASAIIQITLLDKTEPQPSVAMLMKSLVLQLQDAEQTEVSLLYPPLALAQTIVDPVDPAVYARYLVNEPRVGGPKSLVVTEGVDATGAGDTYAPPRGCEAFAISIGLPIAEPLVFAPPFAAWGGTAGTVAVPAGGLTGNLADGAATGALLQYVPQGSDGHFVVFDVSAARNQTADFLRTLADGAPGTISPP